MADVGSTIGLWVGIISALTTFIGVVFVTTFKIWKSVESIKEVKKTVEKSRQEIDIMVNQIKKDAATSNREAKRENEKVNDAQWVKINELDAKIFEHIKDCHR